jgi:hypothetical protein
MGDGVYEGSVIAPQGEGVYFVDVVAMDQTGTPFPFDGAGKIIVDNTPPKISMTLDKKIFASRKRGSVSFAAKLLSLDEIDEWRMEILNSEGKLVRADKGYGKVPGKFTWRGDTNARGRAEDGEYTCRFSVKDAAGNKAVITDSVRVKNNPPDINVDIDIIDDILLFTFKYDPGEDIRSWELSILEKNGNIVKKVAGEGKIPEKLEYPLVEDFDFRKMSFSITALDEAGNSFNLAKPLPYFFSGKRPFARLKDKGRFFDDF